MLKIKHLDDIQPKAESLIKKVFFLVGPMDIAEKFPAELLKNTEDHYCIFVDGGLRHLSLFSHLERSQICSIGDGDSSQSRDFDFPLNTKKDFSDFHAALKLIPNTAQEIHLLGFMGGRLDHQLAIFGPLYRFLKQKKHLGREILFDINRGRFLSAGSHEFHHQGFFSLLAFEETELRLTGACDYPLPINTILEAFSDVAISNCSFGKVSTCCTNPLLLWFIS